jgi:hypothetical protein
MASGRTDEILSLDLQTQFDSFALKKDEIAEAKKTLQTLQVKLKDARNGKDIYLRIRTVAGTLVIIGVAAGAYKITFPAGFKFTGVKLMLSSYLAVTVMNEGMIKLNQSDIENLSREIILGLIKISKSEKALNKNIKLLCQEDPRHRLCYEL